MTKWLKLHVYAMCTFFYLTSSTSSRYLVKHKGTTFYSFSGNIEYLLCQNLVLFTLIF